MFYNKYLDDYYLEQLTQNYDLNFLKNIDKDNFDKVYNLFKDYKFDYIEDIILGYLDIFTMDWEAKPEAIVGAKNNPNELKKPETFQQMTEIANKLSEGFPFVRVDLYEVEGKVYFGEMTFTPATGLLFHFSEEFLLEQGKYCQI